MGEDMHDTVRRFFDEDDWHYDEILERKVLAVAYGGTNGSFTCLAQSREDIDQFLFYCLLPTKVPPERRDEVARFLTRANYGMRVGNFEMDYADGEVRYKGSVDVEDDRLTEALVRNVVYAAVMTMDRYQPGIMLVVYGNVDAQEAIERVEGHKPGGDIN